MGSPVKQAIALDLPGLPGVIERAVVQSTRSEVARRWLGRTDKESTLRGWHELGRDGWYRRQQRMCRRMRVDELIDYLETMAGGRVVVTPKVA